MKVTLKPLITEKTMFLVQNSNQYTFSVPVEMNKLEVVDEVEKRYDVTVLKVRTNVKLGKTIFWGQKRVQGKRSDLKKAIVTLKDGDKITDFNIK